MLPLIIASMIIVTHNIKKYIIHHKLITGFILVSFLLLLITLKQFLNEDIL